MAEDKSKMIVIGLTEQANPYDFILKDAIENKDVDVKKFFKEYYDTTQLLNDYYNNKNRGEK